MDPTQTPRPVVDSNSPRPSLMQVKQNPTLPPGFHNRPPGPPPGSARYPIHNGSTGGPRLVNQPPPDLHRFDSRSTLGPATGLPNQFIQQRPQFGPPRSQISSPTSPGNFPRGLSPSNNPLNQPPLRYPNPASSPNIRGPSYPTPGQRPPFNPTAQQFLRLQRPGSFDSDGSLPPQVRVGTYPQTTENRPVTSRINPDTIAGGILQNNGSQLKNTKTVVSVKEPNTQKNPQIRLQSIEKMESNEHHVNTNIVNKEIEHDDKEEINKRNPMSRNSNDNDDGDNDNDDDDVIMDTEKNPKSADVIQPLTINKSYSSKSPSPVPRSEVKFITDEQSNSRMSVENSPIANNQELFNEKLSQSQINNSKTPERETVVIESKNDILINDENNLMDDVSVVTSSKAKPSSLSLKLDEKSHDTLTTSPIPTTSLTPSPDPTSNVMGYDNGKLRSLSSMSIKSPSLAASSPVPTSSKTPDVVLNAEADKSKIKLSDNIDVMNDELNKVVESTVVKTAKREKLSPSRAETPISSMKRSTSGRSIKSDGGKDNGVSPIVQAITPTTNGVGVSPTKKLPTQLKDGEKSKSAGSPVKSPSKSIKSLPRTPEYGPPTTIDKKKVPMNKVQVGAAPSPNLKTVRSKIGSLDNTSYKPGGGKVKIENRKLDFSKAQPKIAAKNDKYAPSGGDKKITQVKLQWNAKPKVGSLDNATYKPGGGDKKIETVKLDFKDKAKPKVGSKDNAKHVPGGGTVKSTVTPPKTPQELLNDIETQKIDIKAESKVGSMDNMKHKPGGGDKKIFNDRDYLRQTSSNFESVNGSGAQENINELNELKKSNPNPPPSTPTRTRTPLTSLSSMTSPVTARAIRTGLQAKSPDITKNIIATNEENPQSPDISLNLNTSMTNRLETSTSPFPNSPKSSRPSSAFSLQSQDECSSLSNSKKASPKGFHLPKLNKIMSPDVLSSAMNNTKSTTIKLPKLMKTSTLTNRAALAQ